MHHEHIHAQAELLRPARRRHHVPHHAPVTTVRRHRAGWKPASHPRVARIRRRSRRFHSRRSQRVHHDPRLLRGRQVPRVVWRGPGAHRRGARMGEEPGRRHRRGVRRQARVVRILRHLRPSHAAVHEVEPHGRAPRGGRHEEHEVLRGGWRSAPMHPRGVLARREERIRRVLGDLPDFPPRREHLRGYRQGRRVQVRGRRRARGSQVHRRAPRAHPRHVLHRQGAGHRRQGWQDQALVRVHAADVRAQPRQGEGDDAGRVLLHALVPERSVAVHPRPRGHRGRPDPRGGHVHLGGFRD
mmetsp:Transcript_7424/g.33542  ORF Transcript_7424/g.33542 Transcript_7424/m.33542 type:complete len:299 (-) Transcript_7424:4456-5352(-)